MKLRIENNSIRFRITPEELERLNNRGRVEASTKIPSPDGKSLDGEFIYALAVDREGGPTRCLIEPSYIMFLLHPDDLATLNTPGEKGVHFRRESVSPSNEVQRFMAYVEIDKPMKKRNNPDTWLEG